MDNRMALWQHVILSGGSTLFPGLPTRLERDIRALYLSRVLKVRGTVHACRFLTHTCQAGPRQTGAHTPCAHALHGGCGFEDQDSQIGGVYRKGLQTWCTGLTNIIICCRACAGQ